MNILGASPGLVPDTLRIDMFMPRLAIVMVIVARLTIVEDEPTTLLGTVLAAIAQYMNPRIDSIRFAP